MELKNKTTYIAATVLGAALVAGMMLAFPLQQASAEVEEPPKNGGNTNTNINNNINTNIATAISTSTGIVLNLDLGGLLD